MKKNARNLYLRRGTYWFSQQIKGKRTWVNLQTGDEAEAVRRVRLVRADPIMRPKTGLQPEVDAFIAYKRHKGLYSKNSADTKVLILRAFARWLPTSASLANVTAAQCELFHQAVQRPGFDTENRRKLKTPAKPISEVTAHSYMMTIRAFFRWAVEVRRVRFDNPVERLEFGRVEHKARQLFCDKDTKKMRVISLGHTLGVAEPIRDFCDAFARDFQVGCKTVAHDVRSHPRHSLRRHENFEGPAEIVPISRRAVLHGRLHDEVKRIKALQILLQKGPKWVRQGNVPLLAIFYAELPFTRS